MTEYYGSGRFCSSSCSNSRNHSDIDRKRISESVKLQIKRKSQQNKDKYIDNPNYCVICGNVLDYEKRHRKTCSNECKKQLLKYTSHINPNCGGYKEASGNKKFGHKG